MRTVSLTFLFALFCTSLLIQVASLLLSVVTRALATQYAAATNGANGMTEITQVGPGIGRLWSLFLKYMGLSAQNVQLWSNAQQWTGYPSIRQARILGLIQSLAAFVKTKTTNMDASIIKLEYYAHAEFDIDN